MAATALAPQALRPTLRRSGPGCDDQRLVERVRAGDDAAFEAIYDRYAQGLLAFCRHMLSSREEAEDAVQHSFGAAYRTLRADDADIELRPWLYTIARNRCLSLLRSRRPDVSLDVEPGFGPVSDGLADEVQRRSDLRELLEDLQALPSDQRAALVLLEFGGLPHEEIATVLDVRRGKIKALVFQAREGLMRDRRARELPCAEMREQLATLDGKVPRRSMLRRHVDRCPSCTLFEAEVGRQRAGLALILPVLPTVGLKNLVIGSAIGRSAAVAGGGAGAGGGAAVLGGASAGGGGLTCAGGGGGAVALAGAGGSAGAAGGGGILAGAAASGVSASVATAGGAGTIGAAIGAKTAGGVLMKMLAVVAVGGGVAGTAESGLTPVGRSPAAAVQHVDAAVPLPSPVAPELTSPATPAVGTAVDGDGPPPPPAAQSPFTASSAISLPDATSPAAPISAEPASPGVPAEMPSGGTTTGPLQPSATSQTPTTAEPPTTTDAPAATPGPAPTDTTSATTTTTAAAAPADVPASSDTTTTTADSATPDAGAPATAGGTPATTTTPTAGTDPAGGGASPTESAPAPAAPSDSAPATDPPGTVEPGTPSTP
jgi:RNA polymerase sigma factor (sigma-70 family)